MSTLSSVCQILIVDDEESIRKTLADILADAGYTVATAANGAEALNYLRHAQHPRLILLDLMMPIMDGWHFRTRQCNDPALQTIPVVVLSAYLELGQRATTIAADAYLPKPIDLDELLTLVERFCNR